MRFAFGLLVFSLIYGDILASKKTVVSPCPPAELLADACTCSNILVRISIFCQNTQVEKLAKAMQNLREYNESIIFLKLNNIDMPKFPDTLLDGLSVKYLIIWECNITQIEDFAFSKIKNLEWVDLNRNKLTQIPKTLKQISGLSFLSLSQNSLTSLEANALGGLKSLEILELSDNQIGEIHPDALVDTNNLVRISVTKNQLKQVPTEALSRVKSLKFLHLDQNKIHTLTQTDLSPLPELSNLTLANNSLTLLEANLFSNLSNLKAINLAGNQIHQIHPQALDSLNGQLTDLNIANNRLKTIPDLSQWNGLNLVDFKGNPLECSCALQWYHKWMIEHNEDQSSIECINPSSQSSPSKVAFTRYLEETRCQTS